MCVARLWMAAVALQTLLLAVSGGHHRRSMATQAAMSKSGWRPVVGSSGLLYSFGGAPAYKIPVPVLDAYQSSARPIATRDATKLTSIAQSYRPTTLRTVPSAPPANQPINSYHNPFAYNNHQLSYKYVQNIPLDSSLIRNPHNPFAARPAYSKYPNKFKQQAQNNVLQQLTSIQPIHFGQYQTTKPLDIFGKPIETYVRPNEVRKPVHQPTMEIFKPEVFKLPDTDTSAQSVSQQVKTAQQQSFVGAQSQVFNPYPQYTFQDAALPSILGSFGSFGVQSVKGRDPVYSGTKTTFAPPQQTKQTIFNSFSYNPNYKATTAQVVSTTPRYQTTANQAFFGSTFTDYKVTPAPHTKFSTAPKIDPNAGAKENFKPSPQDPFTKHYQNDFNKLTVTTYNPIQTTTLANSYFDYSFPAQQNIQLQTYYDDQNVNYNYEKKKQKIHDNVASSVNQQNKQYTTAPKKTQSDDTLSAPYRPTYEVVETTEPDVASRPSTVAWPLTSQSYNYANQQATEQSLKKQEYETAFSKPTTTPLPELPEEYAIVTEAEKGYGNSLSYDSEIESQSRRPLGDDFEPIGKHKLKDYYYKVSTPAYNDFNARRTKKPSESSRLTAAVETSTHSIKDLNDIPIETLPTLPPNLHFKRPGGTSDPVDKDKIRKRNKIRRRRPINGNVNRNNDKIVTETSTHSSTVQTTESTQTTENQEIHTIRPRVRPTKPYQSNPTTPSVTTDLTTSALPTVFPTSPTIVKKKLIHRRLPTTTERVETTTNYFKDDTNKDSPIMKISNRPYLSKPAATAYEFRTSDTPDYTHKQDEKDTPTSDVDVSLTDTYKTSVENAQEFSFHKDVKPIEAKLEPVTSQRYRETTTEPTSDTFTNTEITTTPRIETSSNVVKGNRTRLRNKYNRPRFSVKDYRNRIGSTTSTDNPPENTPKVRFPQRRVPFSENGDSETTTERKRFTPKDPRHKVNDTDNNEEKEKEIHSIRNRQRQTIDNGDGSTQKISSRIRNGPRRPRPTEETTELPTTVHSKRPLRKKIKDSEVGESVQDISVTETTVYDVKNDITSERSKSESAIMKIADKKHHDHIEHLFEHSKRVSDLTLAASKDYNKPGMFKTVASSSRRIPNYFTIATDDPILPIEAFFPQLNQKKDV
ncbi:proteoglycan 4 [Manduca sexta]|uniref:proteoglycan 4 n=1 Tax=Manduca sexta TaxID=7130 RepID=UPI0018907FD5|nr:proteoglycan 4 [Manduca sexta]